MEAVKRHGVGALDQFIVALKLKLVRWFTLRRDGRLALYDRLASFIEDGLPIYTALSKIRDIYTERKDDRVLMLDRWLVTMRGGDIRLGQALRGWVPDQELALIAAGEESGDLARGLRQAMFMAESGGRIIGGILGAVAYPLFIFLSVVALLIWFSVSLIPTIAELLPYEKWPASTQGLRYMAAFINSYGWFALVALVGLVKLVSWSLPNWVGPVRERVFDRIPPWRLYKVYSGSIFLVSLSAMLTAGIPLDNALRQIKRFASRWTAHYLVRIQRGLREGKGNGEAFALPLFEDELMDDMRIHGSLSSFDKTIHDIGRRSIDRAVKQSGRISKVLFVFLLALSGGLVGYIYFSIYALSTSLSNSVGI